MYLILFLVLWLIIYGTIEFHYHLKKLRKIKIRIHINGTRGKSSVTRLIAAGLRESGIKTFTKTTGTAPALIYPNGDEIPLYRPGMANLIEQIFVIKEAYNNNCEALVIECMALKPEIQAMSEKMIQATISVITNVRLDHQEIMGDTIEEIANCISLFIPKNKILFTAEKENIKFLNESCKKKNTSLMQADENIISNEDMAEFSYFEHKENVALALTVCEHLKVPREVALSGMKKAKPDAGALSIYVIEFFNKKIFFVNAFAANDVQSTLSIWDTINNIFINKKKIVMMYCRADRVDRSFQFSKCLAKDLNADYLVLIGDYTRPILETVISYGFKNDKIISLEGLKAGEIFEKVIGIFAEEEIVIFGIGNIVGLGMDVFEYFKHRGKPYDYSSYWAGVSN